MATALFQSQTGRGKAVVWKLSGHQLMEVQSLNRLPNIPRKSGCCRFAADAAEQDDRLDSQTSSRLPTLSTNPMPPKETRLPDALRA
jgi:hypothetical protein